VKNVAVPSGFAVEGLGFFHISHENLVKHRIETLSAVISVTDSVLSIQNVIAEWQKLIHVGWVRNVERWGNNVILLWAIRRRVLMMHVLSCTVVRELCHSELASVVGAKCFQLEAGLTLCSRLDVFDGSRCTILVRKRDYPHVPTEIIHKQ
jgi:hypothetical protein